MMSQTIVPMKHKSTITVLGSSENGFSKQMNRHSKKELKQLRKAQRAAKRNFEY